MNHREQITWNGQQVEAFRLEVATAQEAWNTYTLADGTILRNKAVLVQVWQLCDVQSSDGSPVYVYQTQNVTSVQAGAPLATSPQPSGWCSRCSHPLYECACDIPGMGKEGTA